LHEVSGSRGKGRKDFLDKTSVSLAGEKQERSLTAAQAKRTEGRVLDEKRRDARDKKKLGKKEGQQALIESLKQKLRIN